ncbi:MAG: hypothetical protein ACE5QV_07100 [Fidelibacterota bacterium]
MNRLREMLKELEVRLKPTMRRAAEDLDFRNRPIENKELVSTKCAGMAILGHPVKT